MVNEAASNLSVIDVLVDISESSTISESIALGVNTVIGIYMPAILTSSVISFMASNDNVNFFDINNHSGSLLQKVVVAGKYLYIDPIELLGARFLKIKTGEAEAADRTFSLVVRILR